MTIKGEKAMSDLILWSQVYQPDNARVRRPPEDRELAEVLVQGHQDPSLPVRPCQDGLITRVHRPVSCPLDVVPFFSELVGGKAPDAGVEEQLQDSVPVRSTSIRSCPTRRRA